nr:MAG TPA: hypothetical protein [Caudoviricetes sp.]
MPISTKSYNAIMCLLFLPKITLFYDIIVDIS